MQKYRKIAQLKEVEAFRERLASLGVELPVDDSILTARDGSPLNAKLKVGTFEVGNRWCIHPMEGWDANPDGGPSQLTLRRWRRFGESGAKWIWGGEAAAVVAEGRANPRQTLATPENLPGLIQLRETLEQAHLKKFGCVDDLLVGLQLTHSGRFARPTENGPAPRIAYHHPLLDAKFGISATDNACLLADQELEQLIESFVQSARLAQEAGFRFVDVKACHGYLVHELLGAHTRSGPFGGDFAGRFRMLAEIIRGIRRDAPDLMIGVRISAFDSVPFAAGIDGVGEPMAFSDLLPYRFGIGMSLENPVEPDLSETIRLMHALRDLGVHTINVSCGSPYYCPHLQRPAIMPPSDGYLPPEDPLCGVARQIEVARQCKAACPELPMVGSGYSYLQQFLPQVAQAVVRNEWIDAVGLGRMVLSYPEMPCDTLHEGITRRKKICRTFSDCTTAPRGGLVSGCYPLDEAYRRLEESSQLALLKRESAQKNMKSNS
ncbi:MAG: NADH:flavin oxidoreductase [Planctomycetota bacterium]|nr:NADH:flavin oxidoreductase [Planctomycetota bacterium]